MNKTKLTILTLIITSFAVNTPLSIVGITLQISQYFKTTIAIAGIYVSSFSFTVAIAGFITPLILSKIERKKVFTLILLIFIISNIINLISDNLIIALICRIIPGLMYPAIVSIILTVAEEIAPKEKTQEYIGLIMVGVSAGSILGLPITTFFGTVFSYKASILWFLLINLISLILIQIFLPKIPGKDMSYKGQISYTKSTKFIYSTIGVFILTVAVSITYNHLSYFLQTITHVYTYNLSLILFIYGLLSIVGTYLSAKILKTHSVKFIILFPILLSIATFGLLKYGEILTITLIFFFIWAILDGCVDNVLQYLEITSIPEAPELGNGVFLSMLNVGIATGTSIGAFLITNNGVKTIFIGSIIVFTISLILILTRLIYFKNSDNYSF